MNISTSLCPPQNDISLLYSFRYSTFNRDQRVAHSVHENEINSYYQNLKENVSNFSPCIVFAPWINAKPDKR